MDACASPTTLKVNRTARDVPIPSPPLDDGIVLLRTWDEADIDQLTAACQDVTLQRFIPIPHPYGREDAERYVARTHRQWATGEKAAFAIVDPEDPATLLGGLSMALCGPTGTAAYWVVPAVRGLGIATRALVLLTDWAFGDLDLGVVLLEIDPANDASQAVARAAGYHECGAIALGSGTRSDSVEHLLFARLAADPHV